VGKGVDKIVDKSVDTAANIERRADELKQAGREAKSAEETAGQWSQAWKDKVPGREKLEGPGDRFSEDGRSVLNQHKLRDPGEPVRWNTADTVGVATEGRRQENEQYDRYHEGQEAYEKEHPEGEGE
jgi:hypothetical protein